MDKYYFKGIEYRFTGIKGYYISNNGKIISFRDKRTCFQPYIMKDFKTPFGHRRIELKTDIGVRKFFVHRLVYQAWVGELKDGMVIEHLDANPDNNYYLNLKQSTQKENIKTCLKQNRKNSWHKIAIILDIEIKKMYIFNKIRDFALFLNLNGDSYQRIFKAKNRRDRYFIIDDTEIGQSTIEKLKLQKKVCNEVEYSESEILSKEVYNYLLSISKRYSQTTK